MEWICFPFPFSWDNFGSLTQGILQEVTHENPGKLNFTHLNLQPELRPYGELILYTEERHIFWNAFSVGIVNLLLWIAL